MKEYWEGRYLKDEKIWGDDPSSTAAMALQRFSERGCRSVLIPGVGYGRNARVFSTAGMRVTGIEISERACIIAGGFVPEMAVINDSATSYDPGEARYDAVYSYNLLHLFLERDRSAIISRWHMALKQGGCVFCAVCSEDDGAYGRGTEVEPGTFESKPGRPVHYFTEADLVSHFHRFRIMETGTALDREDHGEEGPHVHRLRYILAEKE